MSSEEKTRLKHDLRALRMDDISSFMESLPEDFLSILRTEYESMLLHLYSCGINSSHFYAIVKSEFLYMLLKSTVTYKNTIILRGEVGFLILEKFLKKIFFF